MSGARSAALAARDHTIIRLRQAGVDEALALTLAGDLAAALARSDGDDGGWKDWPSDSSPLSNAFAAGGELNGQSE